MRPRLLGILLSATLCIMGQTAAPNVSQVLMYSTITNPSLASSNGITPSVTGPLPQSLLSIYTYTGQQTTVAAGTSSGGLFNPALYSPVASSLSSAISTNIGIALSLVPLESPTSGVVSKNDPTTGDLLPVSNTLGPIFTQRAETIGKGRFYFGFTHQNYHFTELNGQSLNGLTMLYKGNDQTNLLNADGSTIKTSPATVNLGADVRIAQDVAFVTYGVTDSFDLSLGFPIVHASVAARSYNGLIYSGTGKGATGGACWCASTFAPASFAMTEPTIGQSSLQKTGFGDMILRAKHVIASSRNYIFSGGADLRFATGDESNYLGTGTTSIKPFLTASFYSEPLPKNIVLAPHAQISWQYSGKSSLAGTLTGTIQPTTVSGVTIPVVTAPLSITGKDYLPDVLSWSVGAEVAFGKQNTITADILGNVIGLAHGARTVVTGSSPGKAPLDPANTIVNAEGLIDGGKTSFNQYSGAFGYKRRLIGQLVATFQMLVRFDDNGLTARLSPLYGLGYSF